MKSSMLVLFLVLLISSVNSFDPSDYLYSSETASSVSYENFTLNGKDYSIVKISGSEAFLIEEGKLIQDKSQIEKAIYDHYLSKYYPSSSELKNIEDLLDAYNASRNDGNKFPKKEEYVCRDVLFADGRVKTGNKPVICKPDLDNCNYSAMFLYSYLSAATGMPPVGSWTDLRPDIKKFSFASYYTDYILENATSKLEDAKEDDMYDALKYIKDYIPELKSNLTDIEGTKYGWKKSGSSWTIDSSHWAICPPLDLNDSALTKLESDTGTLLTKMAPFNKYKSVASSLHTSTGARLKFHTEETNATYFSSIFNPLSAQAAPVISLSDLTLARISNSSLKSDASSLKSLHSKINSSIKSKDFSTIESDLAKYKTLIPKVNKSCHEAYKIYNQSVAAKNSADSLVFILETKELDPLTRNEFENLKNKTSDLDSAFIDGLDPQKYIAFVSNYTDISNQANSILRKSRESPGSMMFLNFRSFARKVNNGLAAFIESSDVMTAKEVPEKKALTFGGFSFLTFITLGAICLLMFLALLVMRHLMKPSARFILVVVFLIAILSLTAFSAFLFVYLDRTSTDVDIEEFLIDLSNKENVSVLVDLSNAPYGARSPMKSCGSSLGTSFYESNKTVNLYVLDSSGCSIQTFSQDGNKTTTSTTAACLQSVGNESSVITVNHSSSLMKPKFSIIYTSRAHIAADSSYYNSCPLRAIFN